MNRFAALLAIVLIGAPAWCHAEIIPLSAMMTSDQVVSTTTGMLEDTGSDAIGVGLFQYDTDTNELEWLAIAYTPDLLVGGVGDEIDPGTGIFGPAMPGENAPGHPTTPLIDLPTGSLKADTAILSDDEEDYLLSGNMYINIATNEFPSGEIRGQIVPEPASAALLVLGGGAVLALRRGRRNVAD